PHTLPTRGLAVALLAPVLEEILRVAEMQARWVPLVWVVASTIAKAAPAPPIFAGQRPLALRSAGPRRRHRRAGIGRHRAGPQASAGGAVDQREHWRARRAAGRG